MVSVTNFDRRELERFVRDWETAFDRGEHDSMAEAYADDAILVATGVGRLVGRDAIRQFWRDACAGAKQGGIRRTVHTDQYDSCGALGYLQGTVSLRSELTGTTVVWFVTVWARQEDGAWRIVADTSTVVARELETLAVPSRTHHV